MTGLEEILMESMLREDHAEVLIEASNELDEVDMFIDDEIDNEIIDAVIDDEDPGDPESKVSGSMFSIYDIQ